MHSSRSLPSRSAARQRPKPAMSVSLVVIRIGSGMDWFFSRAAPLRSSIAPVQPSSSSAGCNRSCSGERTTGRPSSRLIAVGLKGWAGTAETTSTVPSSRESTRSPAPRSSQALLWLASSVATRAQISLSVSPAIRAALIAAMVSAKFGINRKKLPRIRGKLRQA